MRKTFAKLALLSLTVVVFTACDKYNHAKEVTKQDRMADSRTYGEVDGPALQSKKTYPTNPEAAGKATELRAKMFGDANANTSDGAATTTVTATPAAKADSVKK